MSGGTIPDIDKNIARWQRQHRAHIIILDVGSNDVCQPHNEALTLASKIDDLARKCLTLGALAVVALPVLYRRRQGMDRQSDPRAIDEYNEKTDAMRQYLGTMMDERETIHWEHDCTLHLAGDGIHLDEISLGNYSTSIQKAATFAADRVFKVRHTAPPDHHVYIL